MRESEQRFRRIFEESPIGKLLAEPDGLRIVQANAAFCRMLGYRAERDGRHELADIAHVDDRELLIDAVTQEPERSAGVHVTEARYRHPFRCHCLGARPADPAERDRTDGQELLLLLLIGDITREKRVEAELRQAQKMEAIGQLTGGIAHDFNNLLGVIIGNVEFLLDAVRDKDEAGLANEILNSALSGADLTRRLLAFARRQTLQPRRIDLNAYLPNHVAILRRLLGETIPITTSLAEDLWPTRADPSQVGDALLNLAINARDAMPHGGSISIETANAQVDGGSGRTAR